MASQEHRYSAYELLPHAPSSTKWIIDDAQAIPEKLKTLLHSIAPIQIGPNALGLVRDTASRTGPERGGASSGGDAVEHTSPRPGRPTAPATGRPSTVVTAGGRAGRGRVVPVASGMNLPWRARISSGSKRSERPRPDRRRKVRRSILRS